MSFWNNSRGGRIGYSAGGVSTRRENRRWVSRQLVLGRGLAMSSELPGRCLVGWRPMLVVGVDNMESSSVMFVEKQQHRPLKKPTMSTSTGSVFYVDNSRFNPIFLKPNDADDLVNPTETPQVPPSREVLSETFAFSP
ncbi:hypothetical protein V6N13_059124 [Hibiscus sabdariffa]